MCVFTKTKHAERADAAAGDALLAVASTVRRRALRAPLGVFASTACSSGGSVLSERDLGLSAVAPRAPGGAEKMSVSVLPNGTLQARWTGVRHPTADDLLVLTCDGMEWPLDEGFDAVRVTSRGGDASQLLVNRTALPDLRCPYILRYVNVRGGEGTVLAEARLDQSFGLRPTSKHLSFTNATDQMRVAWVSGHASPGPQVKWGTSPGKYQRVANGTSITYAASDMCNAPANTSGPTKFIDPGYIHRVVLTDLPPATEIFYVVGNDVHGWSKETKFRSRLAPNASAVKFIMYADQALPVPLFEQAWQMTQQVVREINNGFDAFLLHPGDLGYAEGSGAIWDIWGGLVEPITSRLGYEVTVGNHEYDHTGLKLDPSGAPAGGWHPQDTEKWGNFGDDSRGECGVPTVARFDGTGNGNGLFWYSFNEGPVHVITMSSEHDWREGSRQYAWLVQDLRSVDRKLTPWIILNTHRMMYTTQLNETGDYYVSLAFRQHVEPLIYRYKVNAMLVGHQHSYERSCPAVNGSCAADGVSGTTHLVSAPRVQITRRVRFRRSLKLFSSHVDDYGFIRSTSRGTA